MGSVFRRNSGSEKACQRQPLRPPEHALPSTITMNQEKLQQLQAQVRIGGKGTARRKKKVVHRTATTDDKRLQSSLKKLSVNTIPGIEEVNMIKDDGSVIHFNNPKVQASLAAGGGDDDEEKADKESGNDDDEVPDLVGNFDDASKEEGVVVADKDDDKENT